MKPLVAIGVLLFVPVCAEAQAAKPCDDLKAEIAAKMDAKGVKSYTLDIAAKDKDVEGKVVGTCEGGTKKIVYTRASASPQTPAPEAKKP
ncbi:MAG TPA: DUF1161 domain-containing protein [Candidatus Sulfotelmatobacter sp.]|jgi:hypothetical protein|nr:DUF1161 domain-containing protein [Candidatus Sulfotelmatobacter sp.]